MTLNFSGFTNPRTGQRLPSTVLQVWGWHQIISSTYYLSPQHRSRQLKLAGLRDGAWLAGEGEGVLADQEARALPQVQPEEAGREWARGEWWGVSEQQWSESQLEQKWCSLGRRRRGGTCLMSRSHRNLTTNLKSLLLQENNRHWLAKHLKIPTLCTNSFW